MPTISAALEHFAKNDDRFFRQHCRIWRPEPRSCFRTKVVRRTRSAGLARHDGPVQLSQRSAVGFEFRRNLLLVLNSQFDLGSQPLAWREPSAPEGRHDQQRGRDHSVTAVLSMQLIIAPHLYPASLAATSVFFAGANADELGPAGICCGICGINQANRRAPRRPIAGMKQVGLD